MTLGTLFTADFLTEGLPASPAWSGEGAPDAAAIEARFRAILDAVRDRDGLNEAQTEERIFRPMLRALGWEGLFSVQENIEAHGRANVPDYAYFLDAEAGRQAPSRRRRRRRQGLERRLRGAEQRIEAGRNGGRPDHPLSRPRENPIEPRGALGDSLQRKGLAALLRGREIRARRLFRG
jgi:hypothetical protein